MAEETEHERSKADLKDTTIVIMSYISQISAIIVCGVIIFHPPDMKDATVATLIGTILGFLISEAKNFTSYWTGTTRSSSDQQKTIATMAATAGTGNGNGTTTVTGDNPTIVTTPAPTEPVQVVNAPDTSLKIDPGIDNIGKKED